MSSGWLVRVLRCASSSKRTSEEMGGKLGACSMDAEERLGNHVENNSLKKLSLRWLIPCGALPPPGNVSPWERKTVILSFTRVKDLPSFKLSFKMEDNLALWIINCSVNSDFQNSNYTSNRVNILLIIVKPNIRNWLCFFENF